MIINKEKIISCKDFAKQRKEILKHQIDATYDENDELPSLAIIQVGDNEDSNSYVKYKLKDAKEIGLKATLYKISENVSMNEMITLLKELNKNDSCHGIIVQLPLPKHLNVETLQKCISPQKDVDGFRPDSEHTACTPLGIMEYLDENNIPIEGSNITVIGRGKVAGRPMVNLLIDRGATVTCCNSHTDKESLKAYCMASDIIISCTGVNNIVTDDMVSDNTFCVDVGRGDFAQDISTGRPSVYVTPIIGGTGLLTRIALMDNTYESYCEATW